MKTSVYILTTLIITILFITCSQCCSCCPGKKYVVTVTGSTNGGTVWGSSPYTDDSSIARAAVHCGAITVGQTAQVTITVVGQKSTFTASTANGVTTSSYGGWCGITITSGAQTPIDPCNPPLYDCTSIPNCVPCGCQSATFCISCAAGSILNPVSATHQDCQTCSFISPQCTACTSLTTCTACSSGYYVITDPSDPNLGKCDLCSNSIDNCLVCSSASTCTSCATGYRVNAGTGLCECDPVAHSLANCKTCSSSTVCTQCLAVTHFVKASDNLCHLCSQFDPLCSICSAENICTGCVSGYYAINDNTNPNFGKCDLCSNPMNKCTQCLNSNTCTNCDTGYSLNATTHLCDCNPVANNLVYCLTCFSQTVCTACISNSYFVKSADDLCYSCVDFDPFCLLCSEQNICTSCEVTHAVGFNDDGVTTTCTLCSVFMPQCSTCTSQTVCTACEFQYGLNTMNTCTRCDLLISAPCLTCFDYNACQSCKPTHFLEAGVCLLCADHLYKCELCQLIAPNPLKCTLCQTGHFLSLNSCKNCLTKFEQCSRCSANQCFECLSPYKLGPAGKCTLCVPGYYFQQSFCMNIAGCISSVILPNGTQICLACATALNFVFDPVTQLCVCNEGYFEKENQGKLQSCEPICGDGIVLPKYQECDDKNVASNDGCDSSCKVEQDFKCSIDQPSKCVLHVNFSSITYNHVKRILGENTGVLSFTIQPKHKSLEKMDWQKIIKFDFPKSAVDPASLKFSYSFEKGRLQVTVPYTQELQNKFLSTTITFDPDIVVSVPQRFLLFNKLNGINAPLIFQDGTMLSTQKNITIITMVLAILLLLQFYLSSYFHKMIGLETIQVIQCFYFVRMVSKSTKTSVLSSMNLIQYSATGYENAEMIFGPLEDVVSDSYLSMDSNFIAIDMKSFFLMNINFMLIPIALATVAYAVSLIRKYRTRNEYVETRSQQIKDNYTNLRRSAQWVYDHFFFPYVIMFFTIIFFFSIQQLTSQKTNEIQGYDEFMASSFPAHLLTCFIIFAIYCHELFQSLQEFKKYRMTEEERQKVPTSLVEKLQHDENNPDRANYHPAYVLVYLLYYLILNLAMVLSVLVEGFTYSLELTLGLAAGYFILLLFWKPYHQSINVHNHLLKVYYGTFVAFLVICYMFSKVDVLPSNMYVNLIYVIMVLIVLIMVIGFVRLLIEKYYRKKLQNDYTILQWKSQEEQNLNDNQNQDDLNGVPNKKKQVKKNPLYVNNEYLFENQLNKMANDFRNSPNDVIASKFNKNPNQKLSKQQKDFIVKNIRQDTRQKSKNIIIDDMVDSFIQSNKKKNQTTTKRLMNVFDVPYEMQKGEKNQNSIQEAIIKRKNEDNKQLQEVRRKLLGQFLCLHEQN